MNKIIKTILTLSIIMLASCSEQKTQSPTSNLVVGTVQHVKLFSEEFSLELIDVEDNVAVWQASWSDKLHFKQKFLHNIFPVWSDGEKPAFYNKFDHKELDALFPLKVGNMVAFGGVKLTRDNEDDKPFWSVIAVIGEKTLQLGDREYETFNIEISTETHDGDIITNSVDYLWFSPETGLNLMGKSIVNGKKYITKVTAIEYPDQFRPEFKNVGTTLINFEKNQEKETELYEAELQLSGF